MPLSINVGLSRKASRDFQSTGYSINVTAELDQSLLARPDELQGQIDALYAQAASALDRQAGIPEPQQAARSPQRPQERRQYQQRDQPGGFQNGGNGYTTNGGNRNGNGNGNGNGHHQQARSNGAGGMTNSQRRAIDAIAGRINADPVYEAQEIIGKELDQLSIRDASTLIDHLKSLQPSNGNGGGR
jgi:hypothetical protein